MTPKGERGYYLEAQACLPIQPCHMPAQATPVPLLLSQARRGQQQGLTSAELLFLEHPGGLPSGPSAPNSPPPVPPDAPTTNGTWHVWPSGLPGSSVPGLGMPLGPRPAGPSFPYGAYPAGLPFGAPQNPALAGCSHFLRPGAQGPSNVSIPGSAYAGAAARPSSSQAPPDPPDYAAYVNPWPWAQPERSPSLAQPRNRRLHSRQQPPVR